MELPPRVPAALKEGRWLSETHREDRVLVPDPTLFDVEPYRRGSVERAIKRVAIWNREDSDEQLQYTEFNWVDDGSDGYRWHRCYGRPTDGIHRAVAARRLGVPVWVTIHAYYFEAEAVDRYGLPADRQDLAPWLMPEGSHPRPLHEVLALPKHQPRELLRTTKPTEDGLLGFGKGGVARVRLYELSGRTVVLFSTVRDALWGPSPYGSIHGQLEAMQAIWDHILLGQHRHPLDVEWWAHPGGRERKWYEATAEVVVTIGVSGWHTFAPRPKAEDESIGIRLPGKAANCIAQS